MKKKRVLALIVSAVVLVTMSFATTATVFAGEPAGIAVKQLPVGEMPALDMDKLPGKTTKIGNSGTESSIASLPSLPANNGEGVFDASQTQFTVNVPTNGILVIGMRGYSTNYDDYGVNFRTNGFSSDEYLYSGNNYVSWIGVKKGTYTFTTRTYGDIYRVVTAFKAIKESKYGKKRSKAVKIKKKKVQKGLMITGAQKTHWYKFKNKKKHKVSLTIVSDLQDTGKFGGIKLTFYKGKKSYGTRTIFTNDKSVKTVLTPYNTLSRKLTKGTYYIKIAPYNKASGTYTLKWK